MRSEAKPPADRRGAVEGAVRAMAPRIPRHEFEAVVDHALLSRGLRKAAPEATAWLSLVAYARHRFTEYDALLAEGYDGESARFFVRDALNEALAGWGVRRRVGEEDA